MAEHGGESKALAEMHAWVECTDRCDDPREHAFYASGGGFVWRRPKVTVYKPADTRPRAMWNRYPHNVIGAAVVLFGRCWGVTWRGSARRKPVSRSGRSDGSDG